MKKLIIAISLFFVVGLSNHIQAQSININVNINIDKQPSWGPSGYEYAEFYYFPDIDIYYDVANTLFYYATGGKWISSQYLPDKYRKYDLYGLYKIVLNESQPWLQNKTHKKNYSKYKGDKTQEPIRYSNDSKYNNSKGNNVKWVNPNQSQNNNSKNKNNNTNNSRDKSNNNSGGRNSNSNNKR